MAFERTELNPRGETQLSCKIWGKHNILHRLLYDADVMERVGAEACF